MKKGYKGRRGRSGTSLGGREMSKQRRQRLAKRRRAEEAAWAARSGPVKVIRPDQPKQ